MPNSAAKRSMVIGVLRVLIVIIAICCLGLQFSAIAASAGVASKYADADSMHWLYAVAAVLIVACFEFALVPLWRLLTLVEKRDVFSGKAMRWVNHILVYAGIEGMLVLAVMVGQIWLSPSRFLMAAMGVDANVSIRRAGGRSGGASTDRGVRTVDGGDALAVDAGHRTA